MKTTTVSLLIIPLSLAFFGLSPAARAVLPPPAPDGGYPGDNTAEGTYALFSLTTGINNTAIGTLALSTVTDGESNTAIGAYALAANTGNFNTATGAGVLYRNTTGSENTASGVDALNHNTIGNFNTAIGVKALFFNTTGTQNTATGVFALENNNANNNTADGFQALLSNTTGTQNTATGESALKSNSTANNNTADGFHVLIHNTTGAGNTAIGYRDLLNNNGSSNIALGLSAGGNLTTGSNNIDIGSLGGSGESSTIRIGSAQVRTFIKGISGAAVTGATVVVNAGGQLGVAASSARFKHDIHSMDKASEVILALKPVTFHYKADIDPKGIPQFGLVAEEVEKVNPDLVTRDDQGKVYTVRYEAVNAMLLNEFLKEHRKVEQQEATITQVKSTTAKQEATIAEQQKQIEALTTGLQKVSAQVEMSRPAAQMVDNHQ